MNDDVFDRMQAAYDAMLPAYYDYDEDAEEATEEEDDEPDAYCSICDAECSGHSF